MIKISLENVSVEIPVFNATGRSLTSTILEAATGGRLDANAKGLINVTALQKINLSAEQGDRIALLGHNGAGKSTLLRVLGGGYYPSQGKAIITGKTGSLIDIGLGINPEASGQENVFLRGRLLGMTKKQISESYEDIVLFSELGNFMHLPVRTYSTGMQLRLAFAVSTIIRPEILLMDEWLSVGDSDFQHKAEIRLRELVSTTKILVIATHSRELVESVCNRAIWLEHGEIKMDGPVKEVSSAYFG